MIKNELNGEKLKTLALIFMVVEHGVAVLLDTVYFKGIPAISLVKPVTNFVFPVFAFLSVESILKTRHPVAYLKRLFLFALITSILFNGYFVFLGDVTYSSFYGNSATPFEIFYQTLLTPPLFNANIFFSLFFGVFFIHLAESGRLQSRSAVKILYFAGAFLKSWFDFTYRREDFRCPLLSFGLPVQELRQKFHFDLFGGTSSLFVFGSHLFIFGYH